MTHHWVIGLDTNALWEGRGYVQGNEDLTESLHTEEMYHLSAVTFLKHYSRYYNLSFQPETTIHYTNNKGVVSRMKWFKDRCVKTPRDCLAPDYNIQAQVKATYQEMEMDSQTPWVKGHLDERSTMEELKWEEVLNVRVDELATIAHSEISPKDCKNPFEPFPACNAHLFIDNKPITQKIPASI
eukprot:2946457-Ditylum_brightwellii.AAC.2